MARSKTHELIVKVRFDKPVTRVEAAKEFRDTVNGEFYPGDFSPASKMTISGVKSPPWHSRKRIGSVYLS